MVHRGSLLVLLFVLSLAIFSPGITNISVFTDPDEYHRIYRTVLAMIENDDWMAPKLDGIPRVRKPPLTYWMTRTSFETFGVSVTSGRAINLFFAALFVVVVALIGFEYDQDRSYGLNAALIALSMLGMGISSKFLMHDLSAAALSGLAFYCFLVGCRTERRTLLLPMAAALTVGFFIKGPVALVVAGSGIASIFLTQAKARAFVWRSKWPLLLSVAMALGLILGWYAYVAMLYPEATVAQMDRELAARHLGALTWRPLVAVLWMFLPWTFIAFAGLYRSRSDGELSSGNPKASLAIFLALSVLPFFFFHFLDRYLLGSTVPVALLGATALKAADAGKLRAERWAGFALASFIVFLWVGASWWFRTSALALALVLSAYLFFTAVWLLRPKMIPMALSASLVWTTLSGILIPSFGSNRVPPTIVERVREARVILYRIPEPAFLPMMLGRSLEFKEELRPSDAPDLRQRPGWIFVNRRHQKRFEQRAAALGMSVNLVDSYSGFPSTDGFTGQSRDKTIAGNMTRALRTRSLEPIMDTFLLYRTE